MAETDIATRKLVQPATVTRRDAARGLDELSSSTKNVSARIGSDRSLGWLAGWPKRLHARRRRPPLGSEASAHRATACVAASAAAARRRSCSLASGRTAHAAAARRAAPPSCAAASKVQFPTAALPFAVAGDDHPGRQPSGGGRFSCWVSLLQSAQESR